MRMYRRTYLAADLFSFYQWANPQFGLMDASLHTPTFVRGRSALLFSTILSIGATALATLPNSTKQSIDLARALFAHTEKLHLVICAAAAKSIEIVQAELVSGGHIKSLTDRS